MTKRPQATTALLKGPCEVKMERGIMYLRCTVCGCEAPPFDMHDAHDAAVELMKRFVLDEHTHDEERS